MPPENRMEIAFLLAGVAFAAVGVGIIFFEIRARRGTQSVRAQIVGFSLGPIAKLNHRSYYSVAEYVGSDGRRYYVQGPVGSSVPLHAVGDPVSVLVRPLEPEAALLESPLSFVLGAVIGLMGLACVAVFWRTFHADWFSLIIAGVVIGGLVLKIKGAWRKTPLSWQVWQEYRKAALSPRVFTDETKSQISWADPASVAHAIQTYRKTNRFAVPILIVLGFALLLAGQYSYKRTEAFLQRAERATGEVVELKQVDNGDGATYAPVVEYSADDHKRRFVDSLSSNPPSYHTGQTVRVVYSRDNPKDARIDRGAWNYWLCILLGSLGGLFLLLGVSSGTRRSRLSKTGA
jgi:hypothetical protein